MCGALLQLAFPLHLCGSICSSVYSRLCDLCLCASVCMRKRCGHRSCLTNSFESESDSLDNSYTLLPHCPHTHTNHHSHIAFRWRAPPTPSVRGQLIINLPAKWYYISSRARHWPRGSPKKWQCYCSSPNKVNVMAW